MNDLTIFVAARPEAVLILVMDISKFRIFGQILKVLARRVPRHSLVLCGASLGGVFATFLVTIVTAIGAANAGSRSPNESVAEVAGRGRCVVVLLEAMRRSEGYIGRAGDYVTCCNKTNRLQKCFQPKSKNN